jgi:cellobiose phosphorylase
MYRLILESLLGLRLEVDHLVLEPVVPESWPGFKIHYRYRDTVHHLDVQGNGRRVARVIVDGRVHGDTRIPLVDDKHEHWITIELV